MKSYVFDKYVEVIILMIVSPDVMTSCKCMEIFYYNMFYDDMCEHVVMTMMMYSHDGMQYLACGFFLSNVDIMTNALTSCCEVVIARLYTSGPRGPVYLMISWESITTKENDTSNMLWVGNNSINY
jgi:hypothetical protein